MMYLPCLQAVILGEECTRAKPYPDPYLAGLAAIGLEGKADNVLVFEDSPAGIQAARAAGLRVVALRTGQTDAALTQAGATVIVDDFRDVLKWLPA
jgi:beta-phosphoglucomutase-like phosphatase (HAD superfamily)